jgi:hypothetical protein
MFNILAFMYVRVEILLTCEKYLHDPIISQKEKSFGSIHVALISLREEIWVHSAHFNKRRDLGP